MNKKISILIPTYNRPDALAVLLTSLINQSYQAFDIIISDQSDYNIHMHGSLIAAIRVLTIHGHRIQIFRHLPKKGIAEQRQYLVDKAAHPYLLFLDDDLILEQYVLENLYTTIIEKRCGFVGQAPIGLSYANDYRPDQEAISFWKGKIQPEKITPNSKAWERSKLHAAANMYHVQQKLGLGNRDRKPYKIAWVGGCILYDAKKLKDCGGFSFWPQLPEHHCGEEVLLQLRMMKRYGGCAILPSGVYHQELPTTIKERDVNAPEYLSLQ